MPTQGDSNARKTRISSALGCHMVAPSGRDKRSHRKCNLQQELPKLAGGKVALPN